LPSHKEITRRLKSIEGLINTGRDSINEASSDLEALRDEQQEAYENMPEGLQSSEVGEKSSARAEVLGQMVESLEVALEGFSDLEERLDELDWSIE
jgi:predicted  nucleic acid-binding Zn-ribbon protein